MDSTCRWSPTWSHPCSPYEPDGRASLPVLRGGAAPRTPAAGISCTAAVSFAGVPIAVRVLPLHRRWGCRDSSRICSPWQLSVRVGRAGLQRVLAALHAGRLPGLQPSVLTRTAPIEACSKRYSNWELAWEPAVSLSVHAERARFQRRPSSSSILRAGTRARGFTYDNPQCQYLVCGSISCGCGGSCPM